MPAQVSRATGGRCGQNQHRSMELTVTHALDQVSHFSILRILAIRPVENVLVTPVIRPYGRCQHYSCTGTGTGTIYYWRISSFVSLSG